MSEPGATGHRTRTITLAAPIALSLVVLAFALNQHKWSANGAASRAATAVFVASSSRDAGPETLRDAILAADRLSTRAHIIVTAQHITLESALPALVNPNGVDIEAAAGAGTIDTGYQETGAALQVNSPSSTLRGLHLSRARVVGIIVNAPDVQLDSITVTDSKVGILLNATARGCTIRTSTFERDETGLMTDAGIRRVAVLSSIFRGNTRAGLWSVAAAGKPGVASASAPEDSPGRAHVRISDSVFEKNAVGIVLANQPTLIQKTRFLRNRDAAVLILGGAARLEDSEIRDSGGNAVSVTSGVGVVLSHNTFVDNLAAAISVHDSEVEIERNTLDHNGLGIVSVISHDALSTVIADNLITRTTADAVTLIGGAAFLRRNQIVENQGAGLRALDLVQGGGGLKATPHLDANVFKGNRMDAPVTGIYKLSGAP